MSRSQDTVIDDDEETCPLCIEEFDLSDKNFRPCPCGYQICQFCFNSLKTTYEKSTCPNCRRPYDESTIQYKIPTAEEFKLDLMNKNKKQAAAKRKETEKREVETSSRRNLAGVRVKQQNLVYVIGLEPTKKDESVLLETLRGKEFFGQYGDIEKIVVSKAKPGATNQGIGVYVTFRRKEDAATCIDAVDGSVNGERVLRAQYGTTKYCSAFLRGETCMNKNCSFLHETGEDGHHTSLQNEPNDPRPASRPPLHSQISNIGRAIGQPQSPGPSQPMARQSSKDTNDSRKGSNDGSALPATAGWANSGGPIIKARRASQVASRDSPSPQLQHAAISTQKSESAKLMEAISANQTVAASTKGLSKTSIKQPSSESITAGNTASKKTIEPGDISFEQLRKRLTIESVSFMYDDSFLSSEERAKIAEMPPFYDPYGGAKRRLMEEKEVAERARLESEAKIKLEAQAKSAAEDALEEDTMAAGSLALGGEPEDNPRSTSARGAIRRPGQNNLDDQFLSSQPPQQTGGNQRAPGLPQPPSQNTAFELSDFDRRGNQYSQAQYEQISNHQRHGSRYFNSDSKTITNNNNRFQGGQQQSFYSSGVQGPPPGLPTAGTPPVSGGGMFAHGQGFTSTGFGTTKDSNTDLLRGRAGAGAGPDISKRGGVEHLADPSILQARVHQGVSTGQSLFGGNQDFESFPPLPVLFDKRNLELHSRVSSLQSQEGLRSSTPRIPPGFEHIQNTAGDLSEEDRSGALEKVDMQNVGTTVVPAVPLSIPPRASSPKSTAPKMLRPIDTTVDDRETVQSHIDGTNAKQALTTPDKSLLTSEDVVSPTLASSKVQSVQDIHVRPRDHIAEPASSQKRSAQENKSASTKPAQDLPSAQQSSTTDNDSESRSIQKANEAAVSQSSGTGATSPPVKPTEAANENLRRPRTIRLTTSMIRQTEAVSSASPDTSTPAVPSALSQSKSIHSRQPSISSVSRSRPSTPSVSDRLMSQDVSRAGSPPAGGIVGSAPARGKSKSQTKKDRKEKAKKADVVEQPVQDAPTVVNETVAPIVARQKKQKKKPSGSVDTGAKAKTRDIRDGKASTEDSDKAHDLPRSEYADSPLSNQPQTMLVEQAESEAEVLDKESVEVSKGKGARPSFTVRDLCSDAAQLDKDPAAIQKLLGKNVTPVNRLLNEMLSSGDLARDHPWLTNPAFTSAAYKLSSDTRKGQNYLDGNGYGGNDVFGYVYLPQKEKRALYAGHAVSVADTGDRKHDLLRRCLITPNGWVMRHLSAEESERVLELEERRNLYVEEFGELGTMNGLGALEEDDFINLNGGIEELGRYGDRHGICWVTGDDSQDQEGGYDDADEEEMLDYDALSEETDEDLGIDLKEDTGSMSGAWDPALNTTNAGILASNVPTMPAHFGKVINLRAMDTEALQTRVREKQREVETLRKDADKAEKALGKKSKEFTRWRDTALKA